MDNTIQIKSISQMSGMKFMIPDYQRGYRWSKKQAEQLLDDVKDFYKVKHADGEFYCLQPIVVKHLDGNEYEVIDGQQRLTTIFIIIKTLSEIIEYVNSEFELYSICYETCPDSEAFLRELDTDDSKKNDCVDFYHMYKVYETVKTWFKEQGKNVSKMDMLKAIIGADDQAVDENIIDKANNVRVIWYEIADSECASTIDIFTRLNIGKIPLTNSELIKALILKRGNFNEQDATLKQIQIASEWNSMEQKLQNDSFWFFIYNTSNVQKYDNRIEYLFDLMSKRTVEDEYYHTFNWFSNKYVKLKKDVDKLWQQVRNYFQTLEEWFENRELYHYIGFLIEYNEEIQTLKEACDTLDKADFVNFFIKSQIRKQLLKCNLNDLGYEDRKEVRKVLLLFNILTVLETKKSDMRFPFNKFKTGNWDIEHICSQTDNYPSSEKDIRKWADDILEYYTEYSEPGKVQEKIDQEEDQNLKNFLEKVLKLKQMEKTIQSEFRDLFDKAQKEIFKDTQTQEKNHISNLALLDSETNRSYGNAFYPIKRKHIIKNDKMGVFVPIVTKNVFLKFYSTKVDEMMYWTETDAKAYFKAMKEKLSEYLPANM